MAQGLGMDSKERRGREIPRSKDSARNDGFEVRRDQGEGRVVEKRVAEKDTEW